MPTDIILTNLNTQKGDFLNLIQRLNDPSIPDRLIDLKLQSTVGPIPDALEIIEAVHTSEVDIATEASGNLEVAGLLLVAAGLKKSRKATYDAIFKLSTLPEGEGRKKKSKDPYTSCIIETLVNLGAKRRDLIELISSQSYITATDAKKLRIIDDAGIVKSKYNNKNKANTTVASQTTT
jgi:hypothetical protein